MKFWTNIKQVDWRLWVRQLRFLRFVPLYFFVFQRWRGETAEPVGDLISIGGYQKRDRRGIEDRPKIEEFPEWVVRSLAENAGKWAYVEVDQEWNNNWPSKELRIPLKVDPHWNDHWPQEVPVIDGGKFATLNFAGGRANRRHRVFNAEVKTLQFTAGALHIRKCRINHLVLEGSTDVVAEDCWFGIVECRSYGRLRCWGGGILDLPLAAQISFRDAVFWRTWVPRFRLPDETFDVASYRKLRTQFTRENNSLAAGIFHAAELSIERPNDSSWINRVVGVAYELGCDYGNRTFRPMGWFLFVFLAVGTFAFAGDIGVVEPKELVGWQKSLDGSSLDSRLLRSTVLAGQTVANPLGVFGKPLVVAKEFWQVAFLILGSLVGILALAMFLISIRRRFKLE